MYLIIQEGYVIFAKNAKIYAESAKEFFFAVFALFLGVLSSC
jgi:hypothetical protein